MCCWVGLLHEQTFLGLLLVVTLWLHTNGVVMGPYTLVWFFAVTAEDACRCHMQYD